MIRRVAALALVGVAVATAPVGAVANVTVPSQAVGFQPRTVSATLGEVVVWDNEDDIEHTASGKRTLALWSRNLPPGDSTQYPFRQAGTFPYLCLIHPDMTGKVRVPLSANRDSVGVGETITFRVAAGDAPSGFRYQLARRRPGGAWVVWKTTTAKTVSWRPKAKAAGDWELRARTVRTSNSGKSAWSPRFDLDVVT